MDIHILEFNFDDARGPECPYCWHHHQDTDYPESAMRLLMGKTDAWIPVYMTTGDDYSKKFDLVKKMFITFCRDNKKNVAERWMLNIKGM